MSNLLVQNIKHTNNTTSMSIDSSGQISVRGESSATTTNLQQGLAKCWVNFTTETTTATRDSFNFSSLSDEATGNTVINLTNNMANTNYSGYHYTNATTSGTGRANFNNLLAGGFGGFTTSSFGTAVFSSSSTDATLNYNGLFGDLA